MILLLTKTKMKLKNTPLKHHMQQRAHQNGMIISGFNDWDRELFRAHYKDQKYTTAIVFNDEYQPICWFSDYIENFISFMD